MICKLHQNVQIHHRFLQQFLLLEIFCWVFFESVVIESGREVTNAEITVSLVWGFRRTQIPKQARSWPDFAKENDSAGLESRIELHRAYLDHFWNGSKCYQSLFSLLTAHNYFMAPCHQFILTQLNKRSQTRCDSSLYDTHRNRTNHFSFSPFSLFSSKSWPSRNPYKENGSQVHQHISFTRKFQ